MGQSLVIQRPMILTQQGLCWTWWPITLAKSNMGRLGSRMAIVLLYVWPQTPTRKIYKHWPDICHLATVRHYRCPV